MKIVFGMDNVKIFIFEVNYLLFNLLINVLYYLILLF